MEHTNEMSTMERIFVDDAAKKRLPINGSIELLPLCNMNCDMCYVRLSRSEMETQGRLRTVEEWLEIGRQMKDAGVLFLLLTGGEPLIYPGFRELFVELKKMGMILTINTNGTLMDEEWVDFFAKNKPRRINITLYGTDAETYDSLCHYREGYEKVLQGIRMLRSKGVDVRINASITKSNQKDVEKILEMGKKLDAPVCMDFYMMPGTRERELEFQYQSRLMPEDMAAVRIRKLRYEMSEEEFTAFRKRRLWEVENILPDEGPKHMTCQAGKSSFTINWQGMMRPCVILDRPEISVFEHGFEQAWKYMVEETEKIILCEECNTCSLRPICHTCAACALLEAGSWDAKPEYMCRYAKETYRLLKEMEETEENAGNDAE